MNRLSRRRPILGLLAVGAAGALAALVLVGAAVARAFTVGVAPHAKVTNQSGRTTTRKIVVTAGGAPVYLLTGDSARHPKCTSRNGCFGLWPPVKVSSPRKLSRAHGIRGRLGTWHRDGFFQVTLNGHPLYRYSPDSQRNHATGQGIFSFGGTWFVIAP